MNIQTLENGILKSEFRNRLNTNFAELTAETELKATTTNPTLSGTTVVTGTLSAIGTHVFEASSTNDVVRIAQTGEGNALVVEDFTNPDVTPLVVNNKGQLILGSLSAYNANASIQTVVDASVAAENSLNGNIFLRRYDNANGNITLNFSRSRGTQTTPLSVLKNDTIGSIFFTAYEGSGFKNAAAIQSTVDENTVLGSSVPTRLTFWTTLSGSSSQSERVRIIHNGNVGIGTTTPNEVLTVSGNISATGQFLGNVTATGTTTSRSLQNRFAQVFNVKDFGAVGNGIVDDRNAFQSAFNAASAVGGGVVYMPPGRYRKSDTAGNIWTIYSNTSLVGEGDQSVIFFDDKSTVARSGNDMIQTDPSSQTQNIEFKNFKVEGTLLTELTVTNRKQCFTGNNINGLRFENVTMVGLRYMATAFNRVKNGIFTNNRLEYIAFDGLRATSSQNVTFSNNTFFAVTDDCIAAHSYNADSPRSGGFVITGNIAEASQGIKILGSKEIVISNNVFRRSLRSPIHIETTDSPNIEGQTNLFSINIIGNTICDTFGNRGSNTAIYIYYQNGRSKQSLAQQPGVSTEPYSYNYLTDINNGTAVRSGMYGINISNNIITKTLGNVENYSDYGYGELFDRTVTGFWEDPVINDSSAIVHGILIGSAVDSLSITNNHIQGLQYSGITLVNSLTSNMLDFTNCIISENRLIDVRGFGLYITGLGSGQGSSQIMINNNIFDIDPYFKNPNHNSNNTWALTNASYGINASNLMGLYASGNVFKNCSTTGLENFSNIIYPSGKNFIYADFTSGGLNDFGTNKGVRIIPAIANTLVIPISGDPTSPNYGKILNSVVTSSFSQPNNGYYIRGTFVENANPTVLGSSPNQYIVSGWIRLTTGNSHVANTDWIEQRTLTGT